MSSQELIVISNLSLPFSVDAGPHQHLPFLIDDQKLVGTKHDSRACNRGAMLQKDSPVLQTCKHKSEGVLHSMLESGHRKNESRRWEGKGD